MTTAVLYDDLLARSNRRMVEVAAATAGEAAREAYRVAGEPVPGELTLLVNGKAAEDDTPVAPGDQVIAAPEFGDPVNIVLIAVAIASAAASAVLVSRVKVPDGQDTPNEQRFGFSRFSNDAIAGAVKPVVMGEVLRYGGQVVSKTPLENETGDGDSRLKLVLCLSQDLVEDIAGVTSDTDAINAAGMSGLWLNDQPISSFPGCRAWVRMGSTGQAVIPGFGDIEVLREVGVGGAALVNTSGSERTGGSASGEAYTFSTLNAVDAARVRVRLPGGLYTTTTSTQLEPATVKWRVRHRTSDVGSGAGSWSSWQVVTVNRAEQSEFLSTLRIEFGGAAARRDIQAERVTVDAAGIATADRLVWDSVVELTYAANTRAGHALLALELLAGQQLTGEPRVSVRVKGIRPRVWDGVSDPSSPVFARAWSSNPAWLALELLTNTVWGMGAEYTDADVDMASLFEWAAYCDETITTAEGASIARCSFDMVLEEERPGVDWLRAICEAGDCTPVTTGRTWRFVVDRAQTSPVEVFTDGDIEVDESSSDAGEEQVEIGYEHTLGGQRRPNQIIAQFIDSTQDDGTNVIVFPEPGQLWLGSPLNEPVKSKSERLDGIRHPERVFRTVVRRLKRLRFLGRDITFTTTRPVVVVQPGDRFDIASSLPGWGLASGRLHAGCTTTGLKLDREITLESGTTYFARVVQLDGSVEDREITSAAGTYAKGATIAISPALAQAPGEFASYAIGEEELTSKPFICTAVRPTERGGLRWEISGIEYAEGVYDPETFTVRLPTYTTLDPSRPPGPVIDLRAFERRSDSGALQVELAWRQSEADRAHTAAFRIWRRSVGTSTWVLFPVPSVGARGAVFELRDSDRAYEFVVTAVSVFGASLSPYDARHPIVSLVLGLAALPPPAPTGLAATQVSGNTYKLTWDAVEGAVGYQVLYGGKDERSYPNAGGEDCLVLARTTDAELDGLELAPGEEHTFWVRSVGSSGRLSFDGASVTVAPAATPAGETIKQSQALDLENDGTMTNVEWGPKLILTNAALPGVWLGDPKDSGSNTLSEITLAPQTFNNTDDPALNTDPFAMPSIAADQFGVVEAGPLVVGMLWPPWPDSSLVYQFEVRTSTDNVTWTAWETLAPCASIRRMLRWWQVRVTLRRGAAPYQPALAALTVVLTH